MRLAVTGGAGFVGRFVVEEALAAGDGVTVLSRRPPPLGFFSGPVRHLAYELGASVPVLDGFDGLVHAAFSHLPGRYRGGEGDDPAGFFRRNLDGSAALFQAVVAAGVPRIVFLSSRAVYGAYPPGAPLSEDMEPRPDTAYGRVKREAEAALISLCGRHTAGASLRATGVYGSAGAGRPHKWTKLFDRFRRGEPIEPRIGTEVHGADLASAVRLLLTVGPESLTGGIFNASDLVLDRRTLMAELSKVSGWQGALPASCPVPVSVMATERLQALGWTPGGMARLRLVLPSLAMPNERR